MRFEDRTVYFSAQMAQVIRGKIIDKETRCVHYQSATDVIAIKFKCCNQYFPCYSCHEESTDHVAATWNPDEFDVKAVLCGVCKTELTINQYLNCNYNCPACNAQFNPYCQKHYHLYFKVTKP